jgi:hypothetical protein
VEPFSAADRNTLARFQGRFGSEDEDALRVVVERLDALRAAGSAELSEIFPYDQRAAVREAVTELASADSPRGLGLRHRSLLEAKQRGIDLNRLRSVQNQLSSRLDGLLHGRDSFSSSDIVTQRLDPQSDWPVALPDNPDGGTLFVPPFGEPWERSQGGRATGSGRITENRSYLSSDWGRIGSRLVAHNHDASESDDILVHRQSGFIVPFTMPATSIVQVTADLVALLCRHHASTSDEWGWSSFHAQTRSTVVLSIFWDHDDGQPMSEVVSQPLVQGLEARGDGESFPGTVIQVAPGERRTLNLFTDVAFPAGKTVWVYIGMADYVWSLLNDVGIDISLDSAWQLSSLTVSTP